MIVDVDARGEYEFGARMALIIVADADGVIRLVNSAAEFLFGYHRSQLRGQSVEMLLPEERRERHVPLRGDYFLSPRARSMGIGLDLEGRHGSGTHMKLDINLAPVILEEGAFVIVTLRRVGASSHGPGG